MASAAEQLAANINFGAIAKATELKKRLWFTLAALVVYRLGTYIPIPGVDPAVLERIFAQHSGGVLGVFLGVVIPMVVSHFSDIETVLSWWSILLAFGISSAIGMIFGIYPARRAALMDPIEALRHE